jgi:hypothetical protein
VGNARQAGDRFAQIRSTNLVVLSAEEQAGISRSVPTGNCRSLLKSGISLYLTGSPSNVLPAFFVYDAMIGEYAALLCEHSGRLLISSH